MLVPVVTLLLSLSLTSAKCVTHTLLITGAATGGTVASTFNECTGAFISTGTSLSEGASWITLTPNAQRAYLTFRTNSNTVAAFQVSSAGALTALGGAVTVPVPVFSGFDHAQKLLFTASYPGAAIATVKIASNGAVSGTAVVKTFVAPAPLVAPQDQSRPHSSIVDRTGKYVIFPDDGLDVLHVYSIGSTGITFLYDKPSPVRPSGPRHAVLSGYPVNSWKPRLHVVNEVDNSVETWILDYTKSPMTMTVQGCRIYTLGTPVGQSVSTAAELLISPNGLFLLASNRAAAANATGSITVFKLNDPSDANAMTRISITTSGGANPRSMTLDKTGKWLSVVNGNSNNAVIFAFNQVTGKLSSTPTATLSGINVPQTVVFLETYPIPSATVDEIVRNSG